MNKKDILRYIIAFVITSGLFGSVIWLSSYINNMKLSNIKNISNKISIDISSSETQFQLLQGVSCKDVSASTLSSELNDLSQKISYSEQQGSGKRDDIIELKKYYSLLEIKDYLLTKKINQKCGKKYLPILYFYTTAENCVACTKQGYVLSALRNDYPELRVYSFDYNLDLSALRALLHIYKIDGAMHPALIVNEKKVTGFHTIEEIEKLEPMIKKLLLKENPIDTKTEVTQ